MPPRGAGARSRVSGVLYKTLKILWISDFQPSIASGLSVRSIRRHHSPMSNPPRDKELEHAAHQVEKHHDAAHRALAVEAVNRWNGFMRSVGRAGYSPQLGAAIAARF